MGVSASPPEPSSTAFLRVAALVLFGVFLVSVILRALPLRLFDPLWQVSFTSSLLDMGGYALLGVVVLTLAHLLKAGDQRLLLLLLRVSRLSRFAALGYLLLVPLLLSALIRDYQRVELLSQRRLREVNQGEVRLRQAISAAGSRADLLRAVESFEAPALQQFLLSDAPLDAQRARALEVLRSSAAGARRQAGALSPASLQSILLNNLRLVGLALLFAFGFSSANTGGPSFPVLGPLLRPLRDPAPLTPEPRNDDDDDEPQNLYP